MNNTPPSSTELARLLDRVLPEVFPMNTISLDVMREVGKLHAVARRMLADATMTPDLQGISGLPESDFHALIQRAVERESVMLEHMAPHQIVWHILLTVAELRRLLGEQE